MAATSRLQRAIGVAIWLVAILWLIHLVFALGGWDTGVLGIRPGEAGRLYGILTAPLVHGSAGHLVSNTASLLVLTATAFYGFPRAAALALPLIWLGSGAGVWLMARESTHLGASGLGHGLMFFVFLMGVLRRDRPSMALALAVFLLYGGMVWGIFPREPGVSFESHFFGALMGVLAALALRDRDPLATPARHQWREEPELEEPDPVIGDLWRYAEAPEVPSATPREPKTHASPESLPRVRPDPRGPSEADSPGQETPASANPTPARPRRVHPPRRKPRPD